MCKFGGRLFLLVVFLIIGGGVPFSVSVFAKEKKEILENSNFYCRLDFFVLNRFSTMLQSLEMSSQSYIEIERNRNNEVPSQIEQGQKTTFNRRVGAAGARGQFYEIKLSTLFLTYPTI